MSFDHVMETAYIQTINIIIIVFIIELLNYF